jgi:hypothetical protein
MEAWTVEFFDLWQKNRIRIAEAVRDGVQRNPYMPVKGYTVDDLVQMVDGVTAMIREELEGGGSDVRDMYMNAVIPGLLAQGEPLSGLVGQTTMNAIVVHGLIVPQASDKNREQIGTFLTNWYSKFNLDIVRVGLDAGAVG